MDNALLPVDIDNKDKFSQSATPGSLLSRKNDKYSTPTRNTDYSGTPKRNATPSSADVTDTPMRKIQKMDHETPSRKAAKMTPVNIADMLNDDDFTDFMDVELEKRD